MSILPNSFDVTSSMLTFAAKKPRKRPAGSPPATPAAAPAPAVEDAVSAKFAGVVSDLKKWMKAEPISEAVEAAYYAKEMGPEGRVPDLADNFYWGRRAVRLQVRIAKALLKLMPHDPDHPHPERQIACLGQIFRVVVGTGEWTGYPYIPQIIILPEIYAVTVPS